MQALYAPSTGRFVRWLCQSLTRGSISRARAKRTNARGTKRLTLVQRTHHQGWSRECLCAVRHARPGEAFQMTTQGSKSAPSNGPAWRAPDLEESTLMRKFVLALVAASAA